MDVLVKWQDGTMNVVLSSDLETVEENSGIHSGVSIKMYWRQEEKYYFGTVIQTENDTESDEDENLPLSILKENIKKNSPVYERFLENSKSASEITDNDIRKNEEDKSAFMVVEPVTTVLKPVSETDSECDENVPLSILTQNLKATSSVCTNFLDNCVGREPDQYESTDSDHDPTYRASCAFRNCRDEIWAACERCSELLCWEHFVNNETCMEHVNNVSSEDEPKNLPPILHTKAMKANLEVRNRYAVDGEQREVPFDKVKKGNKRKIAHDKRIAGEAYVSSISRKAVLAKEMKPRCGTEKCKSKECSMISEEQRQKIFNAFYGTKSLQLQREFIVRHVQINAIKRKRTDKEDSRRAKTFKYHLPKGEGMSIVCKTMFLHTLGISEKTMRTALSKRTEEGVIQPERRGGRHEMLKENDAKLRASALEHIQKFPRMESHFCRQSTSREYLHPDLTVKKMYHFYQTDNINQPHCSYHTYRRVFKSLNLSFHHPKKDQCSLCLSYRQADEKRKLELEDAYNTHIAEKISVRRKKEEAKETSKLSPSVLTAAVFDLQQVIQLPISKESALFYRRRLSAFNFTIYNIGDKECFCFLWDETISKRGASEISTCVARYLNELDTRGIKEVRLFADGCSGQNRNTIVVGMMLYVITNAKNIEKIVLSYFETNHGQSEGDSAHSSIANAISLAGEVFIPAQLPPILKLARRAMPYNVITMSSDDFYDYKGVADKIRIRSIRKFDSGEDVDWTKVKEVMVNKHKNTCVFVKNSHLAENYYTLSLRRNAIEVINQPLLKLNNGSIKLDAKKYNDLVKLCEGRTPVVRDELFQKFFRDLPYNNN